MKELRFSWQRQPYRFLFVFDPKRRAVILVGASKGNEPRFYQERLRHLRMSLGLSQKDLANLLNVSQPAISKMERQKDMQVGTLASIIGALGGTLEIIAKFPDRGAVKLA